MSASARLPRMNIALLKPMTREEFFLWADAQGGRYEFDGFQPVAMTGGTNTHGRITGNVHFQLRLALRGSSCFPMLPEGGGVATIGNKIRYLEVTVSCSPIPGDGHLIPNPVIVFEVLSRSTKRTDTVDKLVEYHAVSSIKRYVVLEQIKASVTVHSREHDEPWNKVRLGLDDLLDLPEIGIEIPIAELYEGVDLTRPSKGRAG